MASSLWLLLLLCATSGGLASEIHTFGRAERPLYLNKSKTIDQLTFILAHDSHTATPIPAAVLANASTKSLDYFAIDQNNNVTQMLNDGVRALRFNSQNLTFDQTLGQYEGIYMVHGSWVEGFACKLFLGVDMQVVFQTAEDYLYQLREFLIANPDEVLLLLDEGSAGPLAMGEIYTTVFGDVTGFYQVPSPSAPWPTYQELLDRNERLIIFMASGSSESYPFFNSMWYSKAANTGSIMQSPYDYYTPADIKFLPTDAGQHGYTGSGDLGASLYIFNHFFYTDGFPIWQAKYGSLIVDVIHMFSKDFDFGDPTKSNWTVGPQLKSDVYTAWSPKGANQRPNFIAVDFYEGVDGADNVLFELVNEMNSK